uniref:Ribosomal_L7Ae domain-containing protein n=1 Tax=Rhabditophanes sp. KR3021 TaxID=114890 RepID=A0AC35U1N2_9BILA
MVKNTKKSLPKNIAKSAPVVGKAAAKPSPVLAKVSAKAAPVQVKAKTAPVALGKEVAVDTVKKGQAGGKTTKKAPPPKKTQGPGKSTKSAAVIQIQTDENTKTAPPPTKVSPAPPPKKAKKEAKGPAKEAVITPQELGEIVAQVKKAVVAQKQLMATNITNSLFPEVDGGVTIEFCLKKSAPKHPPTTKYISLPHSEKVAGETSVCLILPDIAKTKEVNTNADTEIEARKWAEALEEKHGITKDIYSKVYTLRQLKREVKSREQIKAFANSYDIVMASSNVYKMVIAHLGKHFLANHKSLYPLNLKINPKGKIAEVINKCAIRICPSKSTTSVKIGNITQGDEELATNGALVIETFVQHVPGHLDNIRSIHLCPLTGGTSLPLFISSGGPNDVVIKAPATIFNPDEEVLGELTTLGDDNHVVAVAKSGRVLVRDATTGQVIKKKKKATATK